MMWAVSIATSFNLWEDGGFFQNELKPISIDKSGMMRTVSIATGFNRWEDGGFFQNGLKPISIDKSGMMTMDINSCRF